MLIFGFREKATAWAHVLLRHTVRWRRQSSLSHSCLPFPRRSLNLCRAMHTNVGNYVSESNSMGRGSEEELIWNIHQRLTHAAAPPIPFCSFSNVPKFRIPTLSYCLSLRPHLSCVSAVGMRALNVL